MTDFLGALSLLVWDWDPALIRIGSFEIRYYGVLFALALAVGYMTLRWRYRDEREDPESATNLTYALMIGVVVGARLVHCLFYDFDRYMTDPVEILFFWKGGLASHGAALGLVLVCLAYDKIWRHTPMRVTVDRVAFAIPFAMVCVRLGNFFNSEIVGAPCDPDSPLAVIFTRYDQTPRYPSQLFEIGMGIIAAIVMFSMYFYYKKSHKPRPLGLSASLIITLYFGMRFFVEFFKEYQVDDRIGGLRMGQCLSIPFLIIGLIGIALCIWGPWRKQNVLQFNTKFQLTDEQLTNLDKNNKNQNSKDDSDKNSELNSKKNSNTQSPEPNPTDADANPTDADANPTDADANPTNAEAKTTE